MNESTGTIRFEIDGRWSAAELGKSLLHIEELYDLRLVLQVVYEDRLDWEHIYMELPHFPPFRRWMKRGIVHPALIAGMYPAIPPLPLEPQYLSRMASLLYPHERLEVRRIEYGSPGFKDLAGVGEIVRHIKDFVFSIIEHRALRRRRQLEDERKDLENERLRIENARKFVQLAKECGYTESETRKLMAWVDDRQGTFIQLVEDGKITSVKLLPEEAEPDR